MPETPKTPDDAELYAAVFGAVPMAPPYIDLNAAGARTALFWQDPLAVEGATCPAVHPMGYMCTRDEDHPAPHAASGRPDVSTPPRVVAVWWNE